MKIAQECCISWANYYLSPFITANYGLEHIRIM
jgi:hypothetical protein